MSRRIPLWATLIPLLAGIAVWAFIWRGYAAGFETDLEAVLPAGTAIETGGFPYRLEAEITPAAVVLEDKALSARASASRLTVNRVPWQRDRQVLNLEGPVLELALKPLAGATVRVEAPIAQGSLRMDGPRFARLSAVWDKPAVETGLFEAPVRAERLEAHLRETPAEAEQRPSGPRLPTQAQLVLTGTGLRFGKGAPLGLTLDSELTAPGPITSLAGWERGGTAEIRSGVLSDATGEVARLSATLVPEAGRLRIAGTVETICPATVRAAIAGTPAPAEKRSRKPERIAISGTLPGEMLAAPRDPAKPLPPVRGQEPPCPSLR
jgi:hypothetical protein